MSEVNTSIKRRRKLSPAIEADARAQYISGQMSIMEIARKLDLHYSIVHRWASLGKWKEERERVIQEINARSLDELVKIQAENRLNVVTRHLKVGEAFENQVHRTLEDASKKTAPLSPRDLSDVGKALQAGTTVTARAIGLEQFQMQNGAAGPRISLLINNNLSPIQDAMPEPGPDADRSRAPIDVQPIENGIENGDEF